MAGSNVIPFPVARPITDPLAKTNAWLPRTERWATGSRWGDLNATALTAVLAEAAKGNTWDFADLVEYAIGSDDHLQSLYTTRLTRVVQADWQITAAKDGDPAIAEQAAQLVRDLLPRIDNWEPALRHLLHAIALGYSVAEMRWAHDALEQRKFVEHIDLIHAHRFRWDEQWQLRLWDRGLRPGPEGFGELLDPRFFIAHSHQEVAGYPSKGGVMWACLWRWMFRRWVDKFWIHNVETRGTALLYAIVAPDTKTEVRDRILEQLQNLSSDHVGVIEQGGELKVDATASQTKDQNHLDYMTESAAMLTKAWLGISDAVDPGKSGSQAAVTTRTSAAMDPRMVADGRALSSTLRRTLFRRLVHENAHEFACPVSRIPIPEMTFKTANDEVIKDQGQAQTEISNESQDPQLKAPPDGAPKQPNPRAMARSPKAKAPGKPGRKSSPTTSQTTLPLITPIERALRGELDG